MLIPSRRLLISLALATATLATVPSFAEPTTAPSAAATAILHALTDADADQAKFILAKLSDDQIPAFIAAFNPEDLRPESRDAIVAQVESLVRRARAARLAHERTVEAA